MVVDGCTIPAIFFPKILILFSKFTQRLHEFEYFTKRICMFTTMAVILCKPSCTFVNYLITSHNQPIPYYSVPAANSLWVTK